MTSETGYKTEIGNEAEAEAEAARVSVSASAGETRNSVRESSNDPSKSSRFSSVLNSQGGQSSTHALYKWWKKRQTGTNHHLQQQ